MRLRHYVTANKIDITECDCENILTSFSSPSLSHRDTYMGQQEQHLM